MLKSRLQVPVGQPSVTVVKFDTAPAAMVIESSNATGEMDQDAECFVMRCKYDSESNMLAVALSDYDVQLYCQDPKGTSYRLQDQLKGHTDRINDLCFVPGQATLITVSDDGTAIIWDLRTSKPRVHIQPGEDIRSVAAGNFQGQLACVLGMADGTIQFWTFATSPVRKLALYDESHTQSVTQLCFHPRRPEVLLSAGEDGLLCAFDVRKRTEADALLSVANAESSIRRFGFFGPQYECAWCVTFTETLALWRLQGDCDEIANLGNIRETAARAVGARVDFLLECVYDPPTRQLALLVGDHEGGLRLLGVTAEGVTPLYAFPRGARAHASDVRCFALTPHGIVTGGDDGRLCIWPPASQSHHATANTAKRNVTRVRPPLSRPRHKRHTPY